MTAQTAASAPAPPAAPAPGRAPAGRPSDPRAGVSPVGYDMPVGYDEVPHTAVRLRARRKAIARAMEQAARIPALTADQHLDMTRLLACREELNAPAAATGQDRISVLPLLARAAVAALAGFPALNATYAESTLLQWHPVNLGIAVDAPGGLVVPIVPDAGRLDCRALGERIAGLAAQARAGTLGAAQLQAGTFTISNPGSVGPTLRAEALLNPPQVALLGLGGMRRIPVAVGPPGAERVEVRPVLTASLTFDHRALDGADAIRYLNALREAVEGWDLPDYLAAPTTT